MVRVNRDDLRLMLHGRRLFTEAAEDQVTHIQRMSVEALLARRTDVIVDDMNLRASTVREWARLAARFRATLEVHDLTEVPLEECIRRDAARPDGERVGERNIRRMHDRYLAGRNLPLPVPYVDPDDPGLRYDPDPDLPAAVLVDIDGTVALMGDRSPYDWRRVGFDSPNPAVIGAVRAMHAAGNAIVFCTGRDEEAAPRPRRGWTFTSACRTQELFMRPAGDNRRDALVKQEIFERDIRDRWRDRRRLRRSPPGGAHVARAGPDRLPGRRGRLLSEEVRTLLASLSRASGDRGPLGEVSADVPSARLAGRDGRRPRTGDLSWLDGELVVTEKLDGGNLTFTRDEMYARSLDSGTHPWDRPAKALWAMTAHRIPDDWRVCGESMWARRSIAYRDLPGVFIVFGIWDETDTLLGWDDTVDWAQRLELPVVPVLYRGGSLSEARGGLGDPARRRDLRGLRDPRRPGGSRRPSSRHRVLKWVRPQHVRTEAAWRHRDDFAVNEFA